MSICGSPQRLNFYQIHSSAGAPPLVLQRASGHARVSHVPARPVSNAVYPSDVEATAVGRHGKALAFSHNREPWCTPCKRCASACVACPILSAHPNAHTHQGIRISFCASPPVRRPPLSYRGYARAPYRSCVGTLNLFAYTARRCCYVR